MCGLCRDVLSHPQLFPARNPQSFMMSMADVYDHLQWQLQEAPLKGHRSELLRSWRGTVAVPSWCGPRLNCIFACLRYLSMEMPCFGGSTPTLHEPEPAHGYHHLPTARLFSSLRLSFSRLGASDLKDTDGLPSTEVVKLWQSLPNEHHPMASRKNEELQRLMSRAWQTHVGLLVAALLRAPYCVRLFAGDAESGSRLMDGHRGAGLQELVEEVEREFRAGNFRVGGRRFRME